MAAQEIEAAKPKSKRNPFVFLGSCDSYTAIGDGSFSEQNLIDGFNQYAAAVFRLVQNIIPKLEVQGAQNVLFEGVQLIPSLVKPHLNHRNKFILVTTDEKKLKSNRDGLFKDNQELLERYSIERLMLVQTEIMRQSLMIPNNQLLIIENLNLYTETTAAILSFLIDNGTIEDNPNKSS